MNKRQQKLFDSFLISDQFSHTQLLELQASIMAGLTKAQIDEIANPELSWIDMRAKRLEYSNKIFS